MTYTKQKGPRYRGPFCLVSVMHFYTGQPMEIYSGVDTHHNRSAIGAVSDIQKRRNRQVRMRCCEPLRIKYLTRSRIMPNP